MAAVVWVNDAYIRQGVAWTYLSNPGHTAMTFGETPLPVGKSVYMFGCMLFIRIRKQQTTRAQRLHWTLDSVAGAEEIYEGQGRQ